VRVAFDSRTLATQRDVGRYARQLLAALRQTAGERDEIVESRRPRQADVFHAPWLEGAMLHSPCPMVVTLHDLAALTRRSERLRCGGVHLRLRHLALQRATHVIVPSADVASAAAAELGIERECVVVIPAAPAPPIAGDARQALPSDSADGARAALPTPSAEDTRQAPPSWTWEDVARATWSVYERALSEPARAHVRRRRVARALPPIVGRG
jgi:hypothetical protein